MNNLEIFKKCLKDEAEVILNAIDCFGDEILEAIKIIQIVKGKGHLIINGVGKSGAIPAMPYKEEVNKFLEEKDFKY